jgi:epoxyqueuosine reductase
MPDSSAISSGKTGSRSSQPILDAGVSGGAAPEAATRIKQLGRQAGFDLCRITTASPLHLERARYLEWLAEGRHGSMQWMSPERARRSTEPSDALPAAKSVVCVGMAYWAGHRRPSGTLTGRIARYAWGRDYHAVIGERLEQFVAALRAEFTAESRWYVDTGPMMDKALAARSGLGWYGKNTNILTEKFGSFVLLGEIITTLELPVDEPLQRDCGSCRICMVACPTGALGPDYSMDAGRCISYLTIECRDAIPVEFRSAIGNWVFGCDICQDVCPPTMAPYLNSGDERRAWAGQVRQLVAHAQLPSHLPANDGTLSAAAETTSHPLFRSGVRQEIDLRRLLRLTHAEYLEAFRGTAIRRAKVWMLRRNAAVALGNVGDETCIGDLTSALRGDEHPIVRGHAAWALGQIGLRTGERPARVALREALLHEQDPTVRQEIIVAREVLKTLPVST